MNNPIIDEIREARAALAAEHGYDLVRINDWARQQTADRQARHKPKANQPLLATDGAAEVSGEIEAHFAPHPRQN